MVPLAVCCLRRARSPRERGSGGHADGDDAAGGGGSGGGGGDGTSGGRGGNGGIDDDTGVVSMTLAATKLAKSIGNTHRARGGLHDATLGARSLPTSTPSTRML
eukprot:5642646-Prymnesium_polylepis.1